MKDNDASYRAWVYSKLIVFVLSSIVAVFLAVICSVSLGGIVVAETQSRFFGFVTGLSCYFSCMAGRQWLNATMTGILFTTEEIALIDKMAEKYDD